MKGFGKKLILLGITTAILLLGMEVVIRLSGIVPPHGYPQGLFISDPACEYRMAPSFAPQPFDKQEFSTTVFTNSDGFRDAERVSGPNDKAFRVLVVGDSYVWGAYGVDFEGTFPRLAEKQLNSDQTTTPVEVINIGVPGWGTDNAAQYISAYWKRYQPDSVVLAFCVANDFYDNLKTNEYAVHNGYLVQTHSIDSDRSLRKIRNVAVSTSRLLLLIERAVLRLPIFEAWVMRSEDLRFHGDAQLFELYHSQIVENGELVEPTRKWIQHIASLCSQNGTRLGILPIPSSIQVQSNALPEHPEDDPSVQFDPDAPNRYLKSLSSELGIDYIPTLESFRHATEQEPLFWVINPHFNHAGNQVMAKILTAYLETQIESRKTH